MASTEIEDRRGLTFGQAEGVEALPSQMALRTISPELSAALWAMVYLSLQKSQSASTMYGVPVHVTEPWSDIYRAWIVTKEHKLIDEVSYEWASVVDHIKSIVTSQDYVRVFNFLQFVIQRSDRPWKFDETIQSVLERTRAAYRVLDRHIVPISSDEQAIVVQRAIEAAARSPEKGAAAHLKAGMAALSAGEWADTVRESIHAVESAARAIAPDATTLGPALSTLRKSIGLKQSLSDAFNKLFGYSCDPENGARHALIFEGESKITEPDAIFMFTACAAFVAYLTAIRPSLAQQ